MAHDDKASQEFLDQNQYTKKGILRYEKIFGKGFISTGGLETTQVGNASDQSDRDMMGTPQSSSN